MTLLRARRSLVPLALVLLALVVVAACVPGGAGGSPGASGPSGTPQHPLTPAPAGADPVSLLAFAFPPIFQTMFILLVAVYSVLQSIGVPGAIGIAIIVLTLIVRTVLIPLFRRQL